MQWDGSLQAGFTVGTPWLPISDDYPVVNVRAEDDDATSLLALYRNLLRLRRSHPALARGDYEPVATTGDLLAYVRSTPGKRVLIALNLGAGPYALSLSSLGATGRTVLSTYLDRTDAAPTSTVALRANEGVIVTLASHTGAPPR
jgi:alpha-glucosidase